jgi:hypothetical protein
MLLRSTAKPGRVEEYSEWCRTRHFPDLMHVPGVVGIKRFRDVDLADSDGRVHFVTLFELDCDDPREVVAEFGRRIAAKEMDTSDSYEASSVTMQFTELESESGAMFLF